MSMKILEAKGEITEQKSYPGLYDSKMVHKIKETSAVFNYTGPKFSRQMWNEVLAFFKWTYAKTHGESQVRLFVHPVEGWRAWAFPQEASSGMATTEMPDNPETREQNARMQPTDDWLLYGTVHHHCSAGAFQSGTDRNNEAAQEGIHITVGNIDKEVHSIDCRFYYRGCKFKPDMAKFWDIGDDIRDKADEYMSLFGGSVSYNAIAEVQMCCTSPIGTEFPKQWQDNLIEKKWPASSYQGGLGYQQGRREYTVEDVGYQGYPTRALKMIRKFFRSVYREEIKANGNKVTPEIQKLIDKDVTDTLEELNRGDEYTVVIFAMQKHTCKLEELLKKWKEIQLKESTGVEKPDNEDEPKKEDAPKDIQSMTDAEWEAYAGGTPYSHMVT